MGLNVGAVVGLGVLGLGAIFLIVGLATDEWAEGSGGNYGLWEVCSGSRCVDIDDAFDLTDAFKAVRAMIILAMLASFAAAAIALIHVIIGAIGKGPYKVLPLGCAIFGVVTLILVIIGVIIFAESDDIPYKNTDLDLGYSFALTIVGGILVAIGAIIVAAVGRG